MKTVELAYGRSGLVVDLPASADTIEPRYMPGVPDEAGSLRQALRQPIAGPPLRDLVPRGATVGISVCDVTRPFPAQRVLPVLLEELDYLDPAARIGHPRATWEITQANPALDGVRAIADLAGITFNLAATLNRDHAMTNVFGGELFASHAAGCAFARATAMVRVEAPYDVV